MKPRNIAHTFGPLSFALSLVAAIVSGCGSAGSGSELLPSVEGRSFATGGCLATPIPKTVGYGEMGRYANDPYGCPIARDTCASGLTPHNVDSHNNHERAEDGYFSCWGNSPDVICYSQPKINGYINVRLCYTRPDGSQVDYGCGCP